MFGRRFETIFPRILYSREGISPPKYYHLPPHFHGKGMFAIVKRPKYPYHHPKPPTIDHRRPPPPSLAALRCRRWPPSTAAAGGRRPPSVATGRSPTTTSLKGIFENLSTIPRNLICIPNTPKISYPRKLFPEIAFLRILFLGMKIYSIYQTPPRCPKKKVQRSQVMHNQLFVFGPTVVLISCGSKFYRDRQLWLKSQQNKFDSSQLSQAPIQSSHNKFEFPFETSKR